MMFASLCEVDVETMIIALMSGRQCSTDHMVRIQYIYSEKIRNVRAYSFLNVSTKK